jgi:hypothetical protein
MLLKGARMSERMRALQARCGDATVVKMAASFDGADGIVDNRQHDHRGREGGRGGGGGGGGTGFLGK